MKMTDLFLAELEGEAPPTRRTLERVPEGKNDWKPHPRSMPLGYLAALVARMPGWVAMTIEQDEVDLQPGGGGSDFTPRVQPTTRDLLEVFDDSVAQARRALTRTTDEHLFCVRTRLYAASAKVKTPARGSLRSSFPSCDLFNSNIEPRPRFLF